MATHLGTLGTLGTRSYPQSNGLPTITVALASLPLLAISLPPLPPPVARTLAGTVTETGAPAAGRRIVALDRATQRKLAETVSAANGAFALTVLQAEACTVVAYDDEAGVSYNALILDRVTPV